MTYPKLLLRSDETKISSNLTSFSSFTPSSLFTYGRNWDRPTHNIEEAAYEHIIGYND
jgi:hypothetical protein